MKLKLIASSVLASAMLAGMGISPVMAQGTNTPVVNQQQQEISARIQQGVASGHITPSEAQALHQRERAIQIREYRFKSDGSASQQERQQLRLDLDALRADVERKIANPQVVVQPADNTPVIDQNQQEIRSRIHDGAQSGRLTQKQARSLMQKARSIERLEARYKADGVVTRQERRNLSNKLATLSNEVEKTIKRNERRAQHNR